MRQYLPQDMLGSYTELMPPPASSLAMHPTSATYFPATPMDSLGYHPVVGDLRTLKSAHICISFGYSVSKGNGQYELVTLVEKAAGHNKFVVQKEVNKECCAQLYAAVSPHTFNARAHTHTRAHTHCMRTTRLHGFICPSSVPKTNREGPGEARLVLPPSGGRLHVGTGGYSSSQFRYLCREAGQHCLSSDGFIFTARAIRDGCARALCRCGWPSRAAICPSSFA